jgi:hypothetical protein
MTKPSSRAFGVSHFAAYIREAQERDVLRDPKSKKVVSTIKNGVMIIYQENFSKYNPFNNSKKHLESLLEAVKASGRLYYLTGDKTEEQDREQIKLISALKGLTED